MAGKVKIPAGEKIGIAHGKLQVPDHPIVAFVEGDGTGPDIWRASVRVLEVAVAQAYGGRRRIAWAEVYAGGKAQGFYGADCPPNLLPPETLEVIREHLVATHGTAPKYAGQDKVNPGSVILSGEMMLRYMGWIEAADRLVAGLERTIQQKVVTYDFARLMEGATEVKCSEFGTAVIRNMEALS